MITLEEYLKENIEMNIIDHTVRGRFDGKGNVIIYIHPTLVSGKTLDFIVKDNHLFPAF